MTCLEIRISIIGFPLKEVKNQKVLILKSKYVLYKIYVQDDAHMYRGAIHYSVFKWRS